MRYPGELRFGWIGAAVALLVATAGGAATPPRWPTLDEQLAAGRVRPGTALAALIAANQDFSRLRPEEAKDSLPIPLWLRVHWRRHHPEGVYSAKDPTGGYPFVLKEAYEWLLAHQDLQPGKGVADAEPPLLDKTATAGGELRISGAQTTPRSESDIRVNYWDASKIIAAANNLAGGGQAQFYSTDGGATWGQTSLPLVLSDAFHSDPTVEWTSDGTAWATTIGINAYVTQLRMRAYKSVDNGATWTFDATFSGSQGAADKQIIWVDHSATSPYKDNIYAIWHNGYSAYMNRRTGPGGAWQTPIRVSSDETWDTPIGADVKTNAMGDVFGFWPDSGGAGIFVVKSTNGGASYGPPIHLAYTYGAFTNAVPAMYRRQALIYVSAAAYRTAGKNLVYATWSDLSGTPGCNWWTYAPGTDVTSPCKTRVWFSRSTNGGTTWSAPVKVNDPPSSNDQFNQWLVLDEATGALALTYYDTVADPGRRKADVWYQSSWDDGATWAPAVRVTSVGTDETVDGANLGNQFGDYNGLSGIAGTFFPSWTDRRGNEREEIWTAKVEDPICAPPGAPAIGAATVAGPNQIAVSWSNGIPSAQSFDVYRALGTCAAPGSWSRVGSSVGASPFTDGGVSGGSSYAYRVRGRDLTGHCDSVDSACVETTATGACTRAPTFAGIGSVANDAVSTCGLTLQWAAAAAACGGPVTYDVYRSTVPGFAPAPADRIATGVSDTSYVDAETVVQGTTYYYAVRAVDGANGAADDNSVSRGGTATGPISTVDFVETFEGSGFDNPGWIHDRIFGWTDWFHSTAASQTPTHSWFADDSEFGGERILTSPPFTPQASSTLTFWHTYSLDSGPTYCYDAGTLEVSPDNFSWSVVPDAAFITGGFDATVHPFYGNPMGGKRAWCRGTIGAFAPVTVSLAAYAGMTGVRLRWHSADDYQIDAPEPNGWYVDSVTISNVAKPAACQAGFVLFVNGFEEGSVPGPWSGLN